MSIIDIMINRWKDKEMIKDKSNCPIPSFEASLEKAIAINNLSLVEDKQSGRILLVDKSDDSLRNCWADVSYKDKMGYTDEDIFGILLGQIIRRMQSSLPQDVYWSRIKEIGGGQ